LIIVLSFVVLLTVVVLAMLSHSLLNRMISNASSNVSKTDIYGHGAIEQIIGDLRQEIVAGSTVTATVPNAFSGTGSNTPIVSPYNTSGTNFIYRPEFAANSVPYPSGPGSYGTPSSSSSLWNTTFQNLVKQSTFNVAFEPYDSTVPMRASNVSTTTASLNGRTVSTTRWNKALLLPKKSAIFSGGAATGTSTTVSDGITDTTPNLNFVAPNWILTTANGTNPTTTLNTSSSDLVNSNTNPKSASYVVGRYAYIIYNEGGLLDANVAGCPAKATTAGFTSWEAATLSRKGPAAFADLTQLPGIADLTTLEGSGSLRGQHIVDSLVGWRNAATANDTATNQKFPAFSFNSNSAGNYLTYLLELSSNFMATGYSGSFSSPGFTDPFTGQVLTDQTFTSRQQMINFFENTIAQAKGSTTITTEQAYLQDALMYLGTFSRTLNQPSYWPDPTRPMIQPLLSAGNYGGGNDATGMDNTNNPPFRSIVVGGSGFTRYDGTPANPGDPLVEKRFPLNRLAWLTYKGPSSSNVGDTVVNQTISALGGTPSNSSDPITQYVNNTGTVANIYACFGLTWFSYTDPITGVSSSLWVYNHSTNAPPSNPTSGSPTSPIIMTLSQVAAQGRDPDFIELLKAAICAGSLGAGCQTAGLTETSSYQFALDTTTDYQILQIAANIIEQFKPDAFPVRIEDPASVTVSFPTSGTTSATNGSTSATVSNWVAYGSENLPYIAGLGAIALQIYPYAPSTIPTTGSTATITDAGAGVILGLPVLWNPYDLNSPTPSYNPTDSSTALGSSAAPSSFQLFAVANTSSSSGALSTNNYLTKATSTPIVSTTGTTTGTVTPLSSTKAETNTPYLTYNGSLMTFSVPTGTNTFFREPTVLEQANLPATGTITSKLALGPSNAISTSPFIPNSQAPQSHATLSNASGFTEYMNSRSWIGIYCGQFPLAFTTSGTFTPPNTSFESISASNDSLYPALALGLQYKDPSGIWITYDQVYMSPPAYEAAFTPGTAASWGSADQYGLMVIDPRTSRFGVFGGHNYQLGKSEVDTTNHVVYSNRPDATNGGTPVNYNVSSSSVGPLANPGGSSVTYPGLYSQNAVATGAASYYADPDGAVRRAMGAYASTALTAAASTSGLPMAMAYKPSPTTTTLTPPATQGESRPWMLHRPFRSVSELGYVFRGTPWKNLDFFTPESGDSALLDTFCINEDYRPDAVAAGRVDLNGRQAPVFQALLAGAYRDETAGLAAAPATLASGEPQASLTSTEAIKISQALVMRTTVGGTNPLASTSGPQPLSNIGDIVGRWVSGTSTTTPITGSAAYDGFSADLSLYSGGIAADENVIQRLRESTMRALSDAGQAGTWNLLIDVVAQSGHYPSNASSLPNFLVEGERRYWVHVSIDRGTGQVIDENIEPVNE
jgi:hypothetical protein